jgi:lipopolysaccharide cholinephosphotransferase
LDSETQNHLVIIDRSIDGIEEQTLKLADRLKYDTFVIRLECSKEVVIERLSTREKDPSLHLSRLDKWFEQYENFPSKLVDYSFNVEEDWEKLPLTTLVAALKNKIAAVPSTDSDLPRTSPEVVGALYDCLLRLVPVLDKHCIHYWAFCGTALGIARHGGMIPWDDDIDLAFDANDIEKIIAAQHDLQEAGLLLYQANGYYKMITTSGTPIQDPLGNFYPWTFPFIDLFPMSEMDGKIHHDSQRLREGLPKEYFSLEQVEKPLSIRDFGPIKLPVPNHIEDHLERLYGSDWPSAAYAQYSHQDEKEIKKVKVRLENFSPAEYILP